MKILYSTLAFLDKCDAPAYHIAGFCNALSGLGHTVDLLCPSRTAANEPELAANIRRIPVGYFSFRGWWRILLVWYWIKMRSINLKRYDMLYVRMTPFSFYFSVLTESKTPLVFELNGPGEIEHPGFKKWAPSFTLITTDAEKTIRLATELWRVPAARFAFNQNGGIDPAMFSEKDTPLPDQLKTMLDKDMFLIAHVSSFRSHHDFDTILSALHGIGFPYKIIFMGEGPARKSAEAKCIQQGIPAVFPGSFPLKSLAPFLRRCNLCIDALKGWAQKDGNFRAFKLYEYMAAGVPTIETYDPGLPVTQWSLDCLGLVPYEDPAALKGMIENVHANPVVWHLKADMAQQWVFNNRTWRHVAENMLNAFGAVGLDAK
jgi:glycosyltransferase involved in cell wall biosynthesis